MFAWPFLQVWNNPLMLSCPLSSGHFRAFMSQDHMSLAWLIFGIIRHCVQALDPDVAVCDGHLDTLRSLDEVDWELFED